MTNLPQKNVNSIQFGKEIVHLDHILIPGPPILKEKRLEDCSFSDDPKHTVKLRNFGNSSELSWKFPEIFGNDWIIFGNSGTRQEKNFTPLAQKKLTGIKDVISKFLI